MKLPNARTWMSSFELGLDYRNWLIGAGWGWFAFQDSRYFALHLGPFHLLWQWGMR